MATRTFCDLGAGKHSSYLLNPATPIEPVDSNLGVPRKRLFPDQHMGFCETGDLRLMRYA